jgi:hypothetical protein
MEQIILGIGLGRLIKSERHGVAQVFDGLGNPFATAA